MSASPRTPKRARRNPIEISCKPARAVQREELHVDARCSQSMPTRSMIDDPVHWRQRAEEARRIAEQLDEATAKKTMLEIAASYDQLAALAEAKLASKE